MQQRLLLGLAVLLLTGWGGFPRPVRFDQAPPPLKLPQPLPDRVLHVPILLYHRVSAEVAGLPGLTVSPTDFEAEMAWLHGAGFHAITQLQLFDALEHGAVLPTRPVMITFDDGYRDVLWNAAPVLHRLHMPATVYVITARIDDGDPSFLSWPELAHLRALGFDIGSHTVHHTDLTAVPSLTAYTELWRSRRELERRLGGRVQWLAYPLGHADERVAKLAAAAGYVLAMTENDGVAQRAREPLLLDRERVLPTTGVAGVQALVESAAG